MHWPFLSFMPSPMSIVASKFTFFYIIFYLFLSLFILLALQTTAEVLCLGQAITSTSFRRCRDIAKSTIINYVLIIKHCFYSRGSQIGVHVPLEVHLDLSRGTLLCDRMFLFKLNSVSGRNNRLKCLEFLNPVDCNYVKQDN